VVSFAPVSCIVGFCALPLVWVKLKKQECSPLSRAIWVFVGFAFVHSVIALLIEVIVGNISYIRMLAWAKQCFTLAAGVSVFLVTRATIRQVSDRAVIRYVLVGSIPTLIVGYLNLVWGVTGSASLGSLVTALRLAFAPDGDVNPTRISGIAPEPSHFAFYLIIIVLPCILAALYGGLPKMTYRIWLLVASIALLGTMSGTGFLIGAMTLIIGMKVNKSISAKNIIIISIGLMIMVGIVILIPNNYMAWQIEGANHFAAGEGEASASLADSVFSTLGPFMRLPNSFTSIGYGLGGTATHLRSVLPSFAVDTIASVRSDSLPSLGTLIGKLVAETGLLGLFLFLRIIPRALSQLRVLKSVNKHKTIGNGMALAVSFAIIGNLIGYALKQGSFALPFFWFWLGYCDGRYLSVDLLLCKINV
jgi:hypothetical protein